ncbi:MAG: hypothetical protein P8Y27_17495, partial [Chromatiaceae bacterium]
EDQGIRDVARLSEVIQDHAGGWAKQNQLRVEEHHGGRAEDLLGVGQRDGKSYAIMLINDNSGSTRIMPCDRLNRLHSSRCFQKFTAGE